MRRGPILTSILVSGALLVVLAATAVTVRRQQPEGRIAGLAVGEAAVVDGLEVTVKTVDAMTPRLVEAVAGGRVDVDLRGFRVLLGVRNPAATTRALGPFAKRFRVVQIDGVQPPGGAVRLPFTGSKLLSAAEKQPYQRLPEKVGPGEDVSGTLIVLVPKWAIIGSCLAAGPDGPYWAIAPGPRMRHM